MNAVALIEVAGRRLSNKAHWCQGALARNRRGKERSPAGAAQTCIIGAVYQAAGYNPEAAVFGPPLTDPDKAACFIQHAALREYGMTAERVNDELGHLDVLHVLRMAWQDAKRTVTED